MFDRLGQAAERAAEGVSRRDFFGRLGRGAAVLAAALGGVLLTARDAQAKGQNDWCCIIDQQYPTCIQGKCQQTNGGYGLTVRCSQADIYYKCPLQ